MCRFKSRLLLFGFSKKFFYLPVDYIGIHHFGFTFEVLITKHDI